MVHIDRAQHYRRQLMLPEVRTTFVLCGTVLCGLVLSCPFWIGLPIG